MKITDDSSLQEKIAEMIKQGKTNNEICELLNVNHNHVSYVAKKHNLTGLRYKGRKKKEQSEESGEENKEQERKKKEEYKRARKKCKTCIYRKPQKDTFQANCRYILVEGHSRGCSVEECDKYIKGRPKNIRKHLY